MLKWFGLLLLLIGTSRGVLNFEYNSVLSWELDFDARLTSIELLNRVDYLSNYCRKNLVEAIIIKLPPGSQNKLILKYGNEANQMSVKDRTILDQLEKVIKYCQNENKINFLLSFDVSASPSEFDSLEKAIKLAGKLWGNFLGRDSEYRLFGEVRLDGFNFNIANNIINGFGIFKEKISFLSEKYGFKYFMTFSIHCGFIENKNNNLINLNKIDALFINYDDNNCVINRRDEHNWQKWVTWAKENENNHNLKLFLGLSDNNYESAIDLFNSNKFENISGSFPYDFHRGGIIVWDQLYFNTNQDGTNYIGNDKTQNFETSEIIIQNKIADNNLETTVSSREHNTNSSDKKQYKCVKKA